MPTTERSENTTGKLLTLRIRESLNDSILTAAKRNQLTKSQVARLAIERGLAVLEAQLSGTAATTNTGADA